MTLDDKALLRYSRHILLPQVDIEGQEKLLHSHVLVIGLGGLGSPVSMYLAAAGIGQLTLVDDDCVDESNLQRQIVHGESFIGSQKVVSARARLTELNSSTVIQTKSTRMEESELLELVEDVDVVVDCSDNYSTRLLTNKVCHSLRTPLVSGAAIRFEGQVICFDFRQSDCACYQCLYDVNEDDNLSCAESGVVAPLLGVVGSMQALEVIKLISGAGKPLVNKLALFDGLESTWRYLNIVKDPECACCSDN